MENNSKPVFYITHPNFGLKDLSCILFQNRIFPHSRTTAYSIAKKFRQALPSAFVRVLKIDDSFYVIIDEELYKDFWEFRKIAMRNERRMKNETL